jgi:hypothetical protein
MSHSTDQRRSNVSRSTSNSPAADVEVRLLDRTSQRWLMADHQPDGMRRSRGVDPYNSADRYTRMQAWLHIERR